MSRVLWAVTVLAVLVLAGACRGGGPNMGSDPADRLRSAADRMEGVRRFHFVLEHERGTTPILMGFQMSRAEGDVDGPERMQATIRGTYSGFQVDTGVVVADGGSWFLNPLTRQWEPQPISIREVFDARTGVIALMRNAKSPRITGTERIDGTEVHRLEATLDAGQITLLPGTREPGREVQAVAWIGTVDPLVHRVELRGPIAAGEASDIVRRIELSRFEQAMSIEPPR